MALIAATQTTAPVPAWQRAMDAAAEKWRHHEVAPAIRPYISSTERRRMITACFPMWLDELEDTSLAGRRRIVARLGQALIAEDGRRRSGCWTYSPARHRHMLAVYKRELLDLNAAEAGRFNRRAA